MSFGFVLVRVRVILIVGTRLGCALWWEINETGPNFLGTLLVNYGRGGKDNER